ncbi:MAG: hypothetical protein FWE09_05100 [Treponema sp.]|nr:hypothetical protein [Treponema sp.]
MIKHARAGLLFALLLLFSCDYGTLGGADQTGSYRPGDAIFAERMAFLQGAWATYDGYFILPWGDFRARSLARAKELFPDMAADPPTAWHSGISPGENDFVLMYDDGGPYDDYGSMSYIGLVRALNIFNGDLKRGAIVIEYFKGGDPGWLSDPDFWLPQGLAPGEKPFFGIYFRVIDEDTAQMANAVDLVALFSEKIYHVERRTLEEALDAFSVKNDAEWIDWGIVFPQERQK